MTSIDDREQRHDEICERLKGFVSCMCGARRTMSVPTLTEFLLARIAEDEAAWLPIIGQARRNGKTHARRHLAECEAKRRIVGIYRSVQFGEGYDGEPVPLGGDGPETYWETVRHLATVYADHPDYRDEWRP